MRTEGRLYLVRHPRPDLPGEICYGASDISVSAAERERVALALAKWLPRGLPLYTSPLLRCAELARRLAVLLESDRLLHDRRLREMDFGAWELQGWTDVPRAEVDAWAEDLVDYRPGGGENVRDMARRVHAAYRDLMVSGEDSVVVCHAGTIRMLLACHVHAPTPAEDGASAIDAIARHATAGRVDIAFGGVTVLERGQTPHGV